MEKLPKMDENLDTDCKNNPPISKSTSLRLTWGRSPVR